MSPPKLETDPTPSVKPSILQDIPPTLGQRAAESVARIVGSWWFIGLQTCGILSWVVINATQAWVRWDPYPFILMNLVLSLQAAYTAPMILMSQNRQAEKDRRILYGDYELDAQSHEVLLQIAARLERLEERIQNNAGQDQ